MLGKRRAGGFTYLAIIFAVAIASVSVSALGTMWSIDRQRERERELLFIGDQMRRAIAHYYLNPDAGVHQYPQSLAELLEDRRSARPRHHLRKLFRDPLTNSTEWRLIRTADGGIMGVSSMSEKKPLKQARFASGYAGFENAECYCDWKFVFKTRRARYGAGVDAANQELIVD